MFSAMTGKPASDYKNTVENRRHVVIPWESKNNFCLKRPFTLIFSLENLKVFSITQTKVRYHYLESTIPSQELDLILIKIQSIN